MEQKEMEEKNRKRENAIREGWDTWTFWQVSSTELLEKFSAGCFRPSSIDLPVLLIGGRVSAICARNIASIIGQADSSLIKSGQGPFFFRARSTDLSISRTVYPTSSFLNLVTSDTGSIDWLQIKANLSKVEVFEEHRAAAATRTISIPSCLLLHFLLLPIPSAFLINF